MRQPTPRSLAWSAWRDRLAGADLPITHTPEPGLYRAKRFGSFVAVQIDLLQVVDNESGELLADEDFVAWENDRPVDAWEVWTFCAANPISEAEYERIKKMPVVRDLTREIVV